MRVETNERLVRRNRRIANFLFFFSMIILVGGFIVANSQLGNPGALKDDNALFLTLLLPWFILPVGFIATIASVRMTNLWIRQPRPEVVIQEGLKGVSKKSVLYNYYHFPARHVLVAPQGVFAVITRFQDKRYSVTGEKWREPSGLFSLIFRVFRQDGVRDPFRDARRAAAHVEKLIQQNGVTNVTVQPLVIFVDPRVQLDINEPALPVLYADSKQKPNLTDYLRDLAQAQKKVQPAPNPKQKKAPVRSNDEESGGLSNEQIARITAALDPKGVSV